MGATFLPSGPGEERSVLVVLRAAVSVSAPPLLIAFRSAAGLFLQERLGLHPATSPKDLSQQGRHTRHNARGQAQPPSSVMQSRPRRPIQCFHSLMHKTCPQQQAISPCRPDDLGNEQES